MTDRPKITDHIPEAIRQTVVYICQLAAIRFGSSAYRILARTRSERASPVYSRGDNDARVLAMALVSAAFPERDIEELSGLFRRSRQSMINAIGVASSPRFRPPWGHCAKALQARGIAVPDSPPGWKPPKQGGGTREQNGTNSVLFRSVKNGTREQVGTSSVLSRFGKTREERNKETTPSLRGGVVPCSVPDADLYRTEALDLQSETL